MRNIENWSQTKYELKNGKLRASRNKKYCAVSSRIYVDLIAEHYDIALREYARGHLLDLGCGNVPLYEVYRQIGVEPTCVDWQNSYHKNEYLDIICDLNRPLPIDDESFDTVVLLDVLEHIKIPDKLLCEISRIMKKDGFLLMTAPLLYCVHEPPYDYFRYTQYACEHFAEQANLEIVSILPCGGGCECAGDLLGKLVSKVPVVGSFISEFLRILCVGFRKTPLGVKAYKTSSKLFTLGFFVVMRKPLSSSLKAR